MDFSRRMFLRGAIAATGAIVLPKIALGVPTLYGDNINDDWEGLTALWNGKPVHILTETVTVSPSGKVFMVGGRFLLSKTLVKTADRPQVHAIGSEFRWSKPVDCCIRL